MWNKEIIYDYFPTLSKTGKNIFKKIIVNNPTDIERWFFFANNKDMTHLKEMLKNGFDINSINVMGENLGHISYNLKSISLLNFFTKNKGDLYYKNEDNLSLFELSFYSFCSYRYFYNICKKQKLKQYKHEDWIYFFTKSLASEGLFNKDINIFKIKYLFSHIPKRSQKIIKQLILNYFYNTNKTTYQIPNIIYFLQNKEELLIHLQKSLSANHKKEQLTKI